MKTKIFGKIEEIYDRERYLGKVIKLRKWDGLSKEFWERDQRRGDKMSKEKERKRKRKWDRNRVEFRGRRVQEKWITREVYNKNSI